MTTIFATARPAMLTALAVIALAGCASKPDPNSFGGRLALEGGEVATIGENWNKAKATVADGRSLIEKGEKQVTKGEKQIASGEDNIDDGNSKISKGERMIADGERLAAAAEAQYNARIQSAAKRLPAATN